MMQTFFETVREDDNLRSVFRAAYEKLQQHRDSEKESLKAEGMVIGTAYLDRSPFDTTTAPVRLLYWLIDHPERARELYAGA